MSVNDLGQRFGGFNWNDRGPVSGDEGKKVLYPRSGSRPPFNGGAYAAATTSAHCGRPVQPERLAIADHVVSLIFETISARRPASCDLDVRDSVQRSPSRLHDHRRRVAYWP